MGAGLRRVAYAGKDKEADKAFRVVADQLSYFEGVPCTNGVLLENQDFSGDSVTDKSHALNHQLGRKARGVMVMSCRPVLGNAISVPAGMPVHDSNNSRESNATSMVYMTADMASGFAWSFWVW